LPATSAVWARRASGIALEDQELSRAHALGALTGSAAAGPELARELMQPPTISSHVLGRRTRHRAERTRAVEHSAPTAIM
jgi:hypothetical protein